MKAQVKKLLKIPKIEQKTPEWYAARNNLITASDFAQALGEGKFGTQAQLIEKKVFVDNQKPFVSNMFFDWGNLFEPVANAIYAHMKNATVHEFGLLIHPRHAFLGASPDGITEDGIMLEIKCPLKRKITGEIPKQYYYQIQGQLDVCGLQECDYFECELGKYMTYEDYEKAYEDFPDSYSGVIWDNAGTYEYIHMEASGLCPEYEGNVFYWILKKYYIVRVQKDEVFMTEKIKELKVVWDRILEYRKDPEKFKIEVQKEVAIETEKFDRCMIINVD